LRPLQLVPLAIAGSLLLALAAQPVFADSPSTASSGSTSSQSLPQLEQELTQDRDKLTALEGQMDNAQARLSDLNTRLAQDAVREKAMRQQLGSLARLEYQEPALDMGTILEARSLNELMADVSQSQLVSQNQSSLLLEAVDLQQQDQKAKAGVLQQLAEIKKSQAQAQSIADQAQSMTDAAVAAEASSVYNEGEALVDGVDTQGGPWPYHFAYGYCTWYVATRRDVPWMGNAIDWWPNARAMGYPEGQTPEVGAIMVTSEGDPSVGHVAYVTAVNPNGSWTVSEMNYAAWDVVDTRTLSPGFSYLVGFIYNN
jgi:peptidoglycan DL-endopeptidase CwlO